MSQDLSTDQTQTLLAIGTSYVQGEDVAAKGRIILVSVGKDPQEPSSWVCIARIQLLMSCCSRYELRYTVHFLVLRILECDSKFCVSLYIWSYAFIHFLRSMSNVCNLIILFCELYSEFDKEVLNEILL